MLHIAINILLVIHVLVSLLIVLLVLMQRPKNEGLGAAFGGGMTENLFGAQTSNVLQTFTRYLGALFFILTLLLSWLYVKQTAQTSTTQQRLLMQKTAPAVAPAIPAPDDKIPEKTTPPADEKPAAPETPAAPAKTEPAPAPAPAPAEKPASDEAKPAPAPAPATPAPAPAAAPATPPPAPATPAAPETAPAKPTN